MFRIQLLIGWGQFLGTLSFAKFLSDKIHKLHTSLISRHCCISPHHPPPFTHPTFSSFSSVTAVEVYKLFSQCPDTYNCDFNPIPFSLPSVMS